MQPRKTCSDPNEGYFVRMAVLVDLSDENRDDELISSGHNYELAWQYGKDIVVMEPVKGGLLANVRPDARKVLDLPHVLQRKQCYSLLLYASGCSCHHFIRQE